MDKTLVQFNNCIGVGPSLLIAESDAIGGFLRKHGKNHRVVRIIRAEFLGLVPTDENNCVDYETDYFVEGDHPNRDERIHRQYTAVFPLPNGPCTHEKWRFTIVAELLHRGQRSFTWTPLYNCVTHLKNPPPGARGTVENQGKYAVAHAICRHRPELSIPPQFFKQSEWGNAYLAQARAWVESQVTSFPEPDPDQITED